LLFALGLLTIASEPIVKIVIGAVGGIVLIAFGAVQIRKMIILNTEDLKKPKSSYRHLFFIGIAFTGLNPYFTRICRLARRSYYVYMSCLDGLRLAHWRCLFCKKRNKCYWIKMV
jgi:hypothetical protein